MYLIQNEWSIFRLHFSHYLIFVHLKMPDSFIQFYKHAPSSPAASREGQRSEAASFSCDCQIANTAVQDIYLRSIVITFSLFGHVLNLKWWAQPLQQISKVITELFLHTISAFWPIARVSSSPYRWKHGIRTSPRLCYIPPESKLLLKK